MKVIQICGTNGTGKTTLVKGLLTTGNFLRMELQIDGENKEWWYDGEVAVIGRYTRNNCCGVDAGNFSGEQLIKVIDTILAVYAPNTVLFEDVRFGGSYSFKRRILEKSAARGYEYVSLALLATLKTVSERVINRTGNLNINFDGMMSKSKCVIRSTKKIKDDGATVIFLDTEKLGKIDVLNKVRALIYG